MRGLSLWNPWPFAILHLGKRLENRSWTTCRYRGRIALHASKSARLAYSARTVREWIDAGLMGDKDVERLLGAHASRATVAQMTDVKLGRELVAALPRGHVVGVAEIVDWVGGLHEVFERHAGLERRWYWGGGAIVLDSVKVLDEPVACRGALGLWDVPGDVRETIEQQL